jgi:hypothetical protein
MKKILLPILAFGAVITAALIPLQVASAASCYPGYTCHYRDIAGSCLSYQTQNPYFFNGSYDSQALYGNRQTYPFRAMFNARSTNQHQWDNRYNNYYRAHRYEEDDDAYKYYYGDSDDGDGDWRWYFDEEDDTYNRYRYQSDDDYGYEEYEHTRYYCTGSSCNSTYFRY